MVSGGAYLMRLYVGFAQIMAQIMFSSLRFQQASWWWFSELGGKTKLT